MVRSYQCLHVELCDGIVNDSRSVEWWVYAILLVNGSNHCRIAGVASCVVIDCLVDIAIRWEYARMLVGACNCLISAG